MPERFVKNTRNTVRRAAEIAEDEGAAMVEVEHLLTAIVDPATDATGHALLSAGLTSEAIRQARDDEFRSALVIAGVQTSQPSPAAARRVRRGRSTTFAPSAKLALERSLECAAKSGDRRITSRHLFEAIIGASVGIIPRLLAELGTNAELLRQTVQRDA
jgi:ATP-dependent Clp protease ATP-binding subunit ClpA